MRSRDILREIYEGKITEKEANVLVDQALDDAATQDFSLMGFDLQTEWTAIALYGISYTTVAKWRYEGWPNNCIICAEKIIVKDGNWKAFSSVLINDTIKRNLMVHWDCCGKIEKSNQA